MLFRSGTPRNQVVPQASTTISPPPLRPAKNSGSSFSVASTVLVAIPVVIAVLCCFGCLAWCKLKTGWVLCLFKWIQQSHTSSIHRWEVCCSRKTVGNLVSVTQFLVGGHFSVFKIILIIKYIMLQSLHCIFTSHPLSPSFLRIANIISGEKTNLLLGCAWHIRVKYSNLMSCSPTLREIMNMSGRS